MDLRSLTFSELLDRVSAKTPAPGGGAVTASVAALAAALAQMTVNYSLGRKDLVAHAAKHESAIEQLERARWMLLELAVEDVRAYEELNEAMKTPKDDPARPALLAEKASAAIHPPMATIATCAELLRAFEMLAPITNRMLRSDLAIAAVYAEATARASRWNVKVNLPLVDPAQRTRLDQETDAMLTRAEASLRVIESACG
ncbi:MAG: cyclodeaminase/cyclohydrolase family protein [Phycisphaerae bacterium]|nr:cyclodeaminase/cyclohydrolase family protein [Phycisphaerae bacterium]